MNILVILFLSVFMLASARSANHRPEPQEHKGLECKSLVIVSAVDVKADEELLSVLCAYYDAENSGDWNATFEMRPRLFRGHVDKGFYINYMQGAKQQHSVQELFINSAESDDGRALFAVEFHEARRKSEKGRRSVYGETITFVKENHVWKCESCGVRGRFGINGVVISK